MFKQLEKFLKSIFHKVENVELTTDKIKKLIEEEVNNRLNSADISKLLDNNNNKIKELVSLEGNKIKIELNDTNKIRNIIESEIQSIIDDNQNSNKKLKEYMDEINETLRKELEIKIKDGGKNMKGLNEDLIEEFNEKIIDATNKTIDIILKEVAKHQESNDKLNNYLINSKEEYKKNMEELNTISEVEKKKLQNQIMDLNNKVENYKEKKSLLDTYDDGVSHVRELLNSLEGDTLKELKDLIYDNLKLVEDGSKKEEIENILKVMSKSKPSIVKNLLYEHRESKEGIYKVVNNEEIKFYNAINNYFGSEVVMVNKINDTNIETEYWQLVENKNGSIISEVYLPPMKIAGQIVKGVAKGGY